MLLAVKRANLSIISTPKKVLYFLLCGRFLYFLIYGTHQKVPLFDRKRGCFVPHFYSLPLDLCRKRRNPVLWHFLPNMLQFSAFFRLSFEHASLSPNITLLCCKKDSAFSRITAHFWGLRRIFADYGTLSSRIAVHLQI